MLLYNERSQENCRQEQQRRRQRQLDFKLKRAGFPVRNCSLNILRLKDGLYKVIPAAPAQSAAILTSLLQATPPLRPTTASHQAGAEADAECEDAAGLPMIFDNCRHARAHIKQRSCSPLVITSDDQRNEDDVPRCLAASAAYDPEWREAHAENDPRISTTLDCIMMNRQMCCFCSQAS